MEGADPRKAGCCVRCGRPIAREEPVYRNLTFERDLTEHACHGYVDPDRLIEHAELRARTLSGEYVRDPMLIMPGRNRPLDAREELVDCRNHVVFEAQLNPENPRLPNLLVAMRLAVMGYDWALRDPG